MCIRDRFYTILPQKETENSRFLQFASFCAACFQGFAQKNAYCASTFARRSAGRSAAASSVATTSATAAFTQEAESFAASRTCTAPVSYTHLDVYKRQV